MNTKTKQLAFVILLITVIIGCYKEEAILVKADFSIETINNDYSVPVRVRLINNSFGADSYKWFFPGGSPESSNSKDPGTIRYETPGTYNIKLVVSTAFGETDSMNMEVSIDETIDVGFEIINNGSWFPDASIQIKNTTSGASSYEWTFNGGNPASSQVKDPGTVIFSQPGDHLISLKVSNGKESYSKDTIVTVLPDIVASFDLNWNPADNDMQVPFTAILNNTSISAAQYLWDYGNGTNSRDASPQVTFTLPGTYIITLQASNDKKTKTISKTLTLKANENLFQFEDVKLGINTAQHTVGCYFSSRLGKVLKSNEVNNDNGALIDFVFFGLNSSFTFNKIIAPSEAGQYTFTPIPNAITLDVINKQENCNCTSTLSVAQFDAMNNDSILREILINQNTEGAASFDNTLLPRIVLFKAPDGRKGAVKIKQFIDQGQQSSIIADIKIMKNP
ncbi:PKD domain-containing protein [Niabella ginsengisoli]|uniref:PKD domain-containing protein n=1 Tax=Niabella ginsengisoli TaxID=522298 RepID=A0ABS9SI13_9BACT|nr:PKD domain-containing protein [Niabella ginsengisoli]MCH5597986.1 PKD domain-containing protein [Niabella ginsengisoli]